MKKLLSTFIILFVIAIFSLSAQTRVYPPTLLTPENGEMDQMPNVTLNWNPVTGIHGEVNYDVELDTDAGFSNPMTFNTNLSAVKTSDLYFGEMYYWRVKAIDGPDISDWSEAWSFQVVNTLSLKKPDDNKINIPPSQLLTWDTISGVTKYDIQLDTNYFWKFLPDSTDEDLNDMYFTSGTNGWIVGNNGTLIHIDGTDMSLYAYPGTAPKDLHGVSFSAADNGVAVGADGMILYYDGTDWTEEININSTEGLNDVAVIDGNNAWAVGNAGTVLHYNGTEWTTASITDDDLFGVSFVDANNGWAVGAGGAVYYYNGTEWTSQDAGSKDFYGVYFLDATHGWVCGKSGKIWKYDGSEWTEMDIPSGTKDLNSIFFTGASMGYAIGLEGNFLQYSGGNEWYKQTIGSSDDFNSIFFADATGYTAGIAGLILHDDGSGFSSPHNIMTRDADSGTYVTKFMYFGEKYYWRVRARHSKDTSAWSPSRSFNTVPSVTLESPENNTTDQGLHDEYVWKDLDGVLTYEAQFDDDPNFGTPYIEFTEESSIFSDNFFFGKDYYWRVRANHATDTSAWSDTWMFSIINTVHLSSPVNGATDIQILPTLIWEPISGVDWYQLAYDTVDINNPCCNVLVEAPENEYRVITPMINNMTYFWHVRSINGVDTTAWSDTWSFTIEPVQGIGDLIDDTKVNVYPNPSTGNVFIEYQTQEATMLNVYVMDLVGQTMMQKELFFDKGKSSHALNLGSLPNGIYIIRYQNGKDTYARKITLNK
ncbi:MAG: T9SS type A sorting domain-containing protein [Bacteroidota bacterium]|nr:T9SS type A sorting domain-containing protein [Bacteroidota bacterium]